MLFCEDCGTFFFSEEAGMSDRGFDYEYCGQCGVFHDYRVCCPNCGSEDVVEAGACAVCGEAVRPGDEYCSSCIAEANCVVDLLAEQLGTDNSAAWDLINYIAEERG